jgi:hypothetical protein
LYKFLKKAALNYLFGFNRSGEDDTGLVKANYETHGRAMKEVI